MRPGSFVSAHDVYHSGFYSDDPKGQVRDMAAHPSDEPTEEGGSLMQWLAHTSRGEHVFTMSAHAKTPEHGWACSARGKVLDYSNTVRDNGLHEPDVDGCGGVHPTLFFQLRTIARTISRRHGGLVNQSSEQ